MGNDKRQHGRVATAWVARFEARDDGHASWGGVAEDASPGGVSLRCSASEGEPVLGTRGEIEVVARGIAAPVRTRAEVCWIDRDPSADVLRIGLRFLEADRRIVQLLGDTLARSYFWSSPPRAAET